MTFDEWFHKEYEPADLQIKQYAENKEGLHIPATVYLEDFKKAFEAGQKGKVVEHFEAYGQCRDSRRIAELEEKLKHAEENCINKTCVVFKDKEDCVAKLLELEKENAELKERNAELRGMYVHSAREAGTYKQFLEAKEKENAELKEKYAKNITDCDICDTYCNSQLTKAKEIIKEVMNWYWETDICSDNMPTELRQKAEQFLNSEEK